MASGKVVGFYQTFGIDEPSGCFDDIELMTQLFVGVQIYGDLHPTFMVKSNRWKNLVIQIELNNKYLKLIGI